jgi:hypothetical protein
MLACMYSNVPSCIQKNTSSSNTHPCMSFLPPPLYRAALVTCLPCCLAGSCATGPS